jgi:hypothetical protein
LLESPSGVFGTPAHLIGCFAVYERREEPASVRCAGLPKRAIGRTFLHPDLPFPLERPF